MFSMQSLGYDKSFRIFTLFARMHQTYIYVDKDDSVAFHTRVVR